MQKVGIKLLFFSEKPPFVLYDIDDQGRVVNQLEYSHLSDISLADTDRLTVLIPGERVLSTCVHLPTVSRSQWEKVIPYELENQLASSVEDCFFALGDRDKTHHVPVLVIEKKYFENVLEQLSIANLKPVLITADFMVLPYKEKTWVGSIQGDLISVRTGLYSGYAIEMSNFCQLLKLYTVLPETIWVMGAVGSISGFPEDIPVEIKSLSFDRDIVINLLQGPYRRRSQPSSVPPRWRISCYAGVAVIAGLLFSYIAQYFYFQYRGQQLSTMVNSVYSQLFSHQLATTNLESRAHELLEHVTKVSRSNSFIRLFKLTGIVLKQQVGIDLLSLEYDQKKLSLTLQSKKATTINTFVLALGKKGLQVQQTQKKQYKNKIIISLVINKGLS